MVDDFKNFFSHIQFEQVPRLQNKATDAMKTINSLIEMPQDHMDCEFIVE